MQLSVRIDIPINDFYANNGKTTFMTNIAAFLGIDPGRLKIVGVNTGSTVIKAVVQKLGPALDVSTEATTDASADYL